MWFISGDTKLEPIGDKTKTSYLDLYIDYKKLLFERQDSYIGKQLFAFLNTALFGQAVSTGLGAIGMEWDTFEAEQEGQEDGAGGDAGKPTQEDTVDEWMEEQPAYEDTIDEQMGQEAEQEAEGKSIHQNNIKY